MTPVTTPVTLLAALGAAMVAGVFAAFSSFVVRGLDALPPAQGLAAMQSINRAAVRPAFMTMLFGTALLCLGAGVQAVLVRDAAAWWALAGAALHLAGAVGLTVTRNVPMNDAIAALDPGAAASAGEWAGYVRRWTAWNHARTITCAAGSALLMVALAVGWQASA